MISSFSVATYNILAQTYVRPAYYPAVPSGILDPESRIPAVVERVAGLGADLICLQEVEADVFRRLEERLSGLDYQGRLALKGGGKPDGCASFWRKRAFTLSAVEEVRFAMGHLALVLVLVRDGQTVAVANTHLKWYPRESAPEVSWGLLQARQLLSERARIAPGAWIVCGDLNATPDHEVLVELNQAGLVSAHRGGKTCYSNGRAQTIDYLLHSRSLTARPAEIPSVDDQSPIPSASEPSDHVPLLASFERI